MEQAELIEKMSNDITKNNELIDKLYQLIDNNSYCKDKMISEIQKKFAEQFLSIVDRANAMKNDPSVSDEFRLEDLYEELDDFMDTLEMDRFEAVVGEAFDRRVHSAKERVDTNVAEQDGTICKSFSAGYKQNELIVKPAKVSVYKFIESTEAK